MVSPYFSACWFAGLQVFSIAFPELIVGLQQPPYFLNDLECRRTLSSDYDDRPADWKMVQACTIFVIFHAALQNSGLISYFPPSLLP